MKTPLPDRLQEHFARHSTRLLPGTLEGRSEQAQPVAPRPRPSSQSGGGGGLFTTIVLAAYNSLPDSQVGAHRVCSGTNDHLTIEDAIGDLRSLGGGELVLLEGSYRLGDTIAAGNLHNIHIRGVGPGTVLQGPGSGHGIETTDITFSSFSDLVFSNVNGALYFNHALTVEGVLVQRVTFTETTNCIVFPDAADGGMVDLRILDCRFDQCSAEVYIGAKTDNHIYDVKIEGNICNNTFGGTASLAIGQGSSPDYRPTLHSIAVLRNVFAKPVNIAGDIDNQSEDVRVEGNDIFSTCNIQRIYGLTFTRNACTDLATFVLCVNFNIKGNRFFYNLYLSQCTNGNVSANRADGYIRVELCSQVVTARNRLGQATGIETRILLVGSSDCVVSRNLISGGGAGGSYASSAIVLAATSGGIFSLRNKVTQNKMVGAWPYCVGIAAGCDDNTVTINDFLGAYTTAPIYDAATGSVTAAGNR